jgi:hypothetical protein
MIWARNFHYPFDKTEKEDPEFLDLMLTPTSPKLHKDIFEVCFDEESARIRVKDGMFGRPSVGATIFAHRMEIQMEPVFERAELATNIFVAGSLVGGTGAGLIHQLVTNLTTKCRSVYGLIFLRWFAIPRGAVKQTINDGTLDRNMKYGLDYYFRDTRPLLKASLVIGLPDNPPDARVGPIFLEAGKTDEKRHYFHLAAGYGMLRLRKIAITEQTLGSIYTVSYDKDNPTQMYEEDWGGYPLFWYVNRGNYVKELLDYASSLKFKKAILDSFGFLGKPNNIGRGLYEAINQHKKNQRNAIVEEIVQTWTLLSRQYRFSLSWLDEVLEPLPMKLHHPKYSALMGNEVEKVKEIQTVWARTVEMGQDVLSGPEIAKRFHAMLVENFV